MTAAAPGTRALVAICTAIYALDGLIHTILGPLAPEIARELALGKAELGPIFSSNLIGQCIGLVAFPAIATRVGHRLAVTFAVIGFGLGQCASALADGGTTLFALRLATGVFLGGCLPSCLALVTELAPPERRGLSILTLFTGYGLGAALAGAVAAGFAELGGWRVAMVAVGVLSLLTAVGAWLWLREPTDSEAAAAEPAETSLAALRLLDRRYLVGTLMLWVVFVLMLTISYCLNSWLPIVLVDAGFSESFAALSITVFGFGGAVAALGVGLLIDRFGAMPVLLGFLAAAAALLFAAGQLLSSASTAVLTVVLGAAGFFSLGAYGGVNVVLAAFYPAPLRATGIGWAKSIGRIGTVIAPIAIGFALAGGMEGSTVISLFAAPAVLTGLALLVISTTGEWSAQRSAPAA